MKQFVVIGLGSFGYALATRLYELGHEVIAIDKDPEKVNDIAGFVTISAVAEADDKAALENLGVGNCDVAIISLASDFSSALMCLLYLKEMGVPVVYTKAHTDQQAKVLEKLGSDKILFPERETGKRLAQTLVNSSVMGLLELNDEYSISEILVPEQWVGKSLIDLDLRAKYQINAIALRRNESLLVLLQPDLLFQEQDELIIITSNEQLKLLRRKFHL